MKSKSPFNLTFAPLSIDSQHHYHSIAPLSIDSEIDSYPIQEFRRQRNIMMTSTLEVLERLVLLTWILKDFGWMTTNLYVAFPFGGLSVILHMVLLYVDRRRSYIYYNASLLCWVIGNFLWMMCEFIAVTPSSRIHVGPQVPIGGLDAKTIDRMIDTKTIIILIGGGIQLFMYIGIALRFIVVPGSDTPEDVIVTNEAKLLCCGRRRSYEQTSTTIDPIDFDDDLNMSLDLDGHNSDFTLTYSYISNTFIVFWIVKDSFWAFGTGDLGFADLVFNSKDLVLFYEGGAMTAGALAITAVMISAYLLRRDVMTFLDHIVGILWLSSNYCWMIGEFFLRYRNLELDDGNEGDDMITRIIASVLFSSSFALQLYIIYSMWTERHNTRLGAVRSVEMTGSSNFVQYHNIMVSYAPQKQDLNPIHSGHFEDDDDEDVLF
jgi:hypothetical protein